MKKTIVIVDDDLGTQIFFKQILERKGYEVVSYNNGGPLLEKGVPEGCFLIFMDLIMRGFEGYETMFALRDLGYKTPIIAISSHEEFLESAKVIPNVVEVLKKPFSKEKIWEVLNA